MSERLLELYEELKEKDAEIARLRGVGSWAAGRLLDAGDVEGHVRVLGMLGGATKALRGESDEGFAEPPWDEYYD